MDEREATWIAEDWSGSRGLVPRGPKWLLGWSPAHSADVERHTGRRAAGREIWRIDVGGRFLRSAGTVYPGGVPYPDELVGQTATVSSEVWLYVEDATSRLLGTHTWPEAVRRPVASRPDADATEDKVHHPQDAAARLDVPLHIPDHPGWWPAMVIERSRTDAVVFLVRDTVPDPVNELLLFEQGGLSLRMHWSAQIDYAEILRVHQPPFRRVRVPRAHVTRDLVPDAIGREQGRALGPQTWPWPAELKWCSDGLAYELKGFVALDLLEEVARTLPRGQG